MNNRSNFKKVLSGFLVMSVVCGGEFSCNDTDAMSKKAVENIKKIGKVVGIPLATFLVGDTVGFGAFKISDSISKKKDKIKEENVQYKDEGVGSENVNERKLVDSGTQVEERTVKFQEIKAKFDELCNLKEIYKRFCMDSNNPNYVSMRETINECKRTLADVIGATCNDDDDDTHLNNIEHAYNAYANTEGFAQRTIDCLQIINNCRTSIEGMLPTGANFTKEEFINILDNLKKTLDGANYLNCLTTIMRLESDDKVILKGNSNRNMADAAVSLFFNMFGGNRIPATEVTFAKPETIADKIFDDNYGARLIYDKMNNAKRKFIIGAIKYKYDQINNAASTSSVQ